MALFLSIVSHAITNMNSAIASRSGNWCAVPVYGDVRAQMSNLVWLLEKLSDALDENSNDRQSRGTVNN